MRQDTSGYVRIRQDTSGYVRIRQDTSGYLVVGEGSHELQEFNHHRRKRSSGHRPAGTGGISACR
jgi:hypothetical protein